MARGLSSTDGLGLPVPAVGRDMTPSPSSPFYAYSLKGSYGAGTTSTVHLGCSRRDRVSLGASLSSVERSRMAGHPRRSRCLLRSRNDDSSTSRSTISASRSSHAIKARYTHLRSSRRSLSTRESRVRGHARRRREHYTDVDACSRPLAGIRQVDRNAEVSRGVGATTLRSTWNPRSPARRRHPTCATRW